MIYTYTIPLSPITKKNSQRILTNRRTGRPFIKPSAAYEKYETAAIWYLNPKPRTPIDAPCTATASAKNTKSTPSGAKPGAKRENRSKPQTKQPPGVERKSAATANGLDTENSERVDYMSYTTRNCENCGKLMIHVGSRRRICRECSKEERDKEKASVIGTAYTVSETAKQEQANPPLKRRIKPIPQCVREAEALGISYGRYVQRGYDKVVLSTIKQKERNRKNGRS